MAVTQTTLHDGSRGFVIDPEAPYELSGSDVTGGRFFRDVESQGDDVSGPEDPRAYGNYTYVNTADGRKDRFWDNREEERRAREYVDADSGENPEGLDYENL